MSDLFPFITAFAYAVCVYYTILVITSAAVGHHYRGANSPGAIWARINIKADFAFITAALWIFFGP